uniref:Zinc finger, CCHC-type n=1 Tax=Tanacetum cinerariifolium TaxID=118510 RepID=A0A699ILC1_TANCI|nr:zinc finger, CCHC-type [Tanacetum cinerariifolium]
MMMTSGHHNLLSTVSPTPNSHKFITRSINSSSGIWNKASLMTQRTLNESRDAIFDEDRFSSIPRPKDVIPNLDESQRDDHSDDVPSEITEPWKGKRVRKAKSYGFDFQLYREIMLNHNTHIAIVLRKIL